MEKKLNGTVIVTYRCNARCTMCNRYKAPSNPDEEISLETIKKLPKMYFTNITGGEPFIREDLEEVVEELYKKSDRIVISTNGFFTDRIIKLATRFPNIGIRISIEGLEQTNNEIRGLKDGFNKGYSTLKKLVEMNHPDVGFGMTVQDKNAKDLVALYDLSNEMGMEFATASLHNSFYFVEAKNIIHDRQMVAQNFEDLINKLNLDNPYREKFEKDLQDKINMSKDLLNNFDFEIIKKMTIMNSHGDYSVQQLIYNDNSKTTVIDFETAKKLPIIWEVLRSYSYIDEEAKNGELNIDTLVEYVKEFAKYVQLNEYDLKYAAQLYLIQIVSSPFGYKQYNDDYEKKGLLEFALFRTNLCRYLYNNSKEISTRLQKEVNGYTKV